MRYYPQFGEILTHQLREADRTPSWLARQLGITPSTVTRWLNDGTRPGNPETVIRIGDLLGLSGARDWLLAAAGYGYEGATKSASSNLPRPVTHFIGRTLEIEQISQRLVDPRCRLLTVIGPGGIGKTRLAIEVARRVWNTATHFVDGVYFVSMAEHDSAEQLGYALAEVLGIAIDSGQELQQQLAAYLRAKSILFVLDNFEHRLDAVPRVEQLLNAAAQVHIMTTSRERLRLPGEQLFYLQGLAYGSSHSAVHAEGSTAAELFLQSAGNLVIDLAVTDGEMEQIIEICRRVEGMPLAIELAASWMDILSPGEILAEIQRGLDILATTPRGARSEHASIRALFESTWRRLDAEEQAIFARLGVFRSAFTREAAEAVAGATLTVLSSFVSKSLIQPLRADKRYTFHALLRQFAEEKLQARQATAAETYERLSDYYGEFLERQAPRLEGREYLSAMREIEAEIENIRVAWQWAAEYRLVEPISRSLRALETFFDVKSWYAEAFALFAQAADSFEMDEPVGRQGIVLAKLLGQKAVIIWQAGLPFRAGINDDPLLICERSLQIAEKIGESDDLAFALDCLGGVQSQEGRIEEAIQYFQQALVYYEMSREFKGIYQVTIRIGVCLLMRGKLQEAIPYFRRAIAICEEQGNLTHYLFALLRLADTLRTLGQYDDARNLALSALENSSKIGSKRYRADSLQVLSETAWNMGDFETASKEAQECIEIATESGWDYAKIFSQLILGRAACSLGDFPLARHYFSAIIDPALTIFTITNSPDAFWRLADPFVGMAHVLVGEGKSRLATELLDHVLQYNTWKETGNQAAALMSELMATDPELVLPPRRPFQVVISEILVA